MNYTLHTKTIDLGDGRPVTIETGKLAKQAHGSVVIRMGDTMILAAAVANHEAKEGVDFLPLTVDYREKYAAAGRFPGGFFKREARPSDDEVLVMRLVDRALRPTFPGDFHADTQVQIMVLSADLENMPDCLAGLAASAAICVSNIPFNGPISEVRVARIEGKFVINPTKSALAGADMDMMIAGSMDSIVMVEGEMLEVSEAEMLEAIDSLAFLNMHDRILKYLKDKVMVTGATTLTSTHQEIAFDLHSSRVVVSRILKSLEKDGLIKMYRNKIEVLNF